MISLAALHIPLYWLVLTILFYTIFLVFLVSKIERKFNEKKEKIEELEKELFQKDNILKEEVEKQNTEKDFIDNLLDSANKFSSKFELDKKELKKKETNQQKGKNFEWQIYNYFNNLGYEVENRSAKYKKQDGGIDILTKKDSIYTLIQCKNFAPTTKIKHNLVKEFNGNCTDFINKNNKKLNTENTRFLLIISNYESLEKCALHYLNDNNNKCEYLEIKYQEDN